MIIHPLPQMDESAALIDARAPNELRITLISCANLMAKNKALFTRKRVGQLTAMVVTSLLTVFITVGMDWCFTSPASS
jgi:hypothetical protein